MVARMNQPEKHQGLSKNKIQLVFQLFLVYSKIHSKSTCDTDQFNESNIIHYIYNCFSSIHKNQTELQNRIETVM